MLSPDGEYEKARLFAGEDKIRVGFFQDIIIDLNVVFDRIKEKSDKA